MFKLFFIKCLKTVWGVVCKPEISCVYEALALSLIRSCSYAARFDIRVAQLFFQV